MRFLWWRDARASNSPPASAPLLDVLATADLGALVLGALPLADVGAALASHRAFGPAAPLAFDAVLDRELGRRGLAGAPGRARSLRAYVETGASERRARDLYVAAAAGRADEVAALAARGAALSWRDDCSGFTPLLHAATHGHARVVALLLSCGVAPDSATGDTSGAQALALAAHNGHGEVAGLLLDHGAAVDAGDRKGTTALWLASWYGRVAVVRRLLDKGASPHLAPHSGVWRGTTPLSIAQLNPLSRPECEAVSRVLEAHAPSNRS